MRNIPQKVDGIDVLEADEFNSINDELRTAILDTGQTIPGADNQVSTSIFNAVAMGDYYLESGSADALTLILANVERVPSQFFDGLRARFIASNSNTGDPSGVRVTFGTLGGPKDITMLNGDPLASGEIVAGELYEIVYRVVQDRFIIS